MTYLGTKMCIPQYHKHLKYSKVPEQYKPTIYHQPHPEELYRLLSNSHCSSMKHLDPTALLLTSKSISGGAFHHSVNMPLFSALVPFSQQQVSHVRRGLTVKAGVYWVKTNVARHSHQIQWIYKLKNKGTSRPALNIRGCTSQCIFKSNVIEEKLTLVCIFLQSTCEFQQRRNVIGRVFGHWLTDVVSDGWKSMYKLCHWIYFGIFWSRTFLHLQSAVSAAGSVALIHLKVDNVKAKLCLWQISEKYLVITRLSSVSIFELMCVVFTQFGKSHDLWKVAP